MLILERAAVRGIWAVLTPSKLVTTMNVSARSAVSREARDGVTYQRMPILNAQDRVQAMASSQALIAGGITTA